MVLLEREIRACDARILAADLPVVQGDAVMLAAVVNNLLINALRHGPRRDGEVRIEGAPALVDIGTDPDEPQATSSFPTGGCSTTSTMSTKPIFSAMAELDLYPPESTHCAIRPADVEAWSGRWDALGLWIKQSIFGPPDAKRRIPRQLCT
jgi:hypothetical protein